MKMLFKKLLVFAVIFISVDNIIGFTLTTISAKIQCGYIGKGNDVANRTNAEIILLGSSRCEHHYNPEIITDSFGGMSCYNAGRTGNGILLMYPYYKMLSARYHPKLVLYDLSVFDVVEDDHTKYLDLLRQFYGRTYVDSMVWTINSEEKYKMMCKAYRFNGKGLQIISDAVHPSQQYKSGFLPLYGVLNFKPKNEKAKNMHKQIDPLKKKYLVRLMQDCRHNGTKIVFFVSPSFDHIQRSEYYNAISELCRSNKVLFFYHHNDSRFIHNRAFFKDSTHLNNIGADAYTKVVVSETKKYLFHHK